VHCVQPAGNDTIAGPLRRGENHARNVACTTRISGLQVASVVDGHLAIEACRASGGTGHLISDEQVWQAQRQLAREEGIFCEPAGATALAGALLAAADGTIQPNARVVCLVTGSGFKDEASITRMLDGVDCPLIDLDQLSEVMGG
jgi:threonine synthase